MSLKSQKSFASLRELWTEEEKKTTKKSHRRGNLFHGSTEGGLIGEGAFGSVIQIGVETGDGSANRAMKRLADREMAEREERVVEMLQELEGPPYYEHCIMPILDFIWHDDEAFVCSIQMPHFETTLGVFTRNFQILDVVHRDDRSIIVDVWKNVWDDICDALTYLSKHTLFHGDVKGDNILLKEADRRAVLGDTGSIKTYRSGDRGEFTDQTASPETFSGAACGPEKPVYTETGARKIVKTPACLYWLAGFKPTNVMYLLNDDIFSFGIVMLEMWSRSFHKKNQDMSFWLDFLKTIDKFGAPLIGVCLDKEDQEERREAVIKWLNEYLRQYIGVYVPKVYRSMAAEIPLYTKALSSMTEADYRKRQRFNQESRSFLDRSLLEKPMESSSSTSSPKRLE